METSSRAAIVGTSPEPLLTALRAFGAALLGRSRDLITLRGLGAALGCAVVATLGSFANAALDWPMLRAQVSLSAGSLACSLVLAERWSADPERFARGSSLALLAGVAAGLTSLG